MKNQVDIPEPHLRIEASGRMATVMLMLSTYFLALIFLFAGIDKLYHYDGFLNALNSYVLVPKGAAEFLAAPLIMAEICTGLGLLAVGWRRTAALAATVLLGIFIVALAFNYFFQPGSICGCWFTITLAKGTKLHVLQNSVLLGLALSIWFELTKLNKHHTPG